MKVVRQEMKDNINLFQGISYPENFFSDHKKAAADLKNKKLYTITVLIENLRWELSRKKVYIEQTRTSLPTLYNELLYKYFFEEYGDLEANKLYGQWLEDYKTKFKDAGVYHDQVDELIRKEKLTPRYYEQIIKRKSVEKLYKPRYKIERRRLYNLPEPLNRVDYRSSYDNIFVWEEGDKKYAARGGSGSSGQRERNSVYSFAYMLVNKVHPIPSYICIYDEENKLQFVKRFSSLCLPWYDIGSNYSLSPKEAEILKKAEKLFTWDQTVSQIGEIKFEK